VQEPPEPSLLHAMKRARPPFRREGQVMSANTRLRVSLFGNFGRGNIGNDCTLHAMVCNVRRHVPDADIRCICKGPEETSSRYQIAAVPMRDTLIAREPRPRTTLLRRLRRLVIGLATEIYRWARTVQTLRQTDVLVMTGTGMLGDFGILPLDIHLDILRWSIVARLCRCRLLFVSVGAGPLDHPLSRRFVRWALALADYRSYRDNLSKQYLEGVGIKTDGDAVYPDLAFSLPRDLVPPSTHRDGSRRVVGVGLMAYYGGHHTTEPSEAIHHDYIVKLATFVTWLLDHQYTVRLLIGDTRYDGLVRRELMDVLEERHTQYQHGQLLAEPIASSEDVFSQLASVDVVVASRFHNVLMALMLGKPAVAISYHEKIDALMDDVGLPAYCQHIDRLDVRALIDQFTTLEANAEDATTRIARKIKAYRTRLDDQYERIFTPLAPDTRHVRVRAFARAPDPMRGETR
jgi:polysaccharide pyruvyl transferase WcaK-like protein